VPLAGAEVHLRSKEGETAETAEQEVPGHRVELRLALPRESATADGQAAGTVPLAGAEVHRLALPPMVAGNLMLVAAASSAELILSVERRDPDDSWHAVALDQGRAPVVAIPTDGDALSDRRASARRAPLVSEARFCRTDRVGRGVRWKLATGDLGQRSDGPCADARHEQTGPLRRLRHVVRIGEPLRAVGEQIAELKFAESCQRQIEAAELQFAELEAEEFRVPA